MATTFRQVTCGMVHPPINFFMDKARVVWLLPHPQIEICVCQRRSTPMVYMQHSTMQDPSLDATGMRTTAWLREHAESTNHQCRPLTVTPTYFSTTPPDLSPCASPCSSAWSSSATSPYINTAGMAVDYQLCRTSSLPHNSLHLQASVLACNGRSRAVLPTIKVANVLMSSAKCLLPCWASA